MLTAVFCAFLENLTLMFSSLNNSSYVTQKIWVVRMSLDLLVRIFSMIPWLRASSVPTPKVRKIITAGRSHIGDRRPLRPWPRLLRLFCGMSKCQVPLSTRAGWPFFLSQSPLNQKMGFAEFSQQAGWSHHRSYLSSTISWWKHCLIV